MRRSFAQISHASKTLTVLAASMALASSLGCKPDPETCDIPVPTAPFEGSTSQTPDNVLATEDGRLLITYNSGPSQWSARYWNGTQWSTQAINPAGATGYNSTTSVTYLATLQGIFTALINITYPGDTGNLMREYAQQPDGSFAAGVPTGASNLFVSSVTGSDAVGRIIVGAANSGGTNVYTLEKSAGTWSQNFVFAGSAAVSGSPIGIGYAPDGTAWLLVQKGSSTTLSIDLYRRIGTTWSLAKHVLGPLVSGVNLYNPKVVESPEGAPKAEILLAWEEISGSAASLKALRVDLGTNDVSPTVTVATPTVNFANGFNFSAAFKPGSNSGVFAWADHFDGRRLFLGKFTESAFGTPELYKPSSLVATPAWVFQNACGTPYFVYGSKETTSAPLDLRIETLRPQDTDGVTGN